MKMLCWMRSFLKAKLGEDEYETAAIITMTEAEASTLYQILKARGEEVHYIDRNSSVFKKRTYRHDLLSCKRVWNSTRYSVCSRMPEIRC